MAENLSGEREPFDLQEDTFVDEPGGGLRPGLRQEDFRCIGDNGLGDPLNSYPHSMAWFRGALYVGTTRNNMCMLNVSKLHSRIEPWPVECPDNLYDQDMRAQIWRYAPQDEKWTMVYRSPEIDTGEEILPRELGYRGMTVFKGRSDAEEALYVCSYAPVRGRGARILRSLDGETFKEVPLPREIGEDIITLRLLTSFKGRLFTSPTGRAGGRPNVAEDHAVIYGTDNPSGGQWHAVSESGFGDPGNIGVFELIGCGDYLYAGTANLEGYQIWRTKGEGIPPYQWERVVTKGAHRGPLNQGVASFCVHDGMLFAGSGIQHGGIDIGHGVGPAPPELIRIAPDGSWDLIVGRGRETPDGPKEPLSGFLPGYGNLFAGYFWRMESHGGWLYLGTFDWSLMLRYAKVDAWPAPFRRMIERVGVENVINHLSGADLYRSCDGVNWMPVTTQGFGNPYNYGLRTLQSTPYGLAAGLVNPFAPKVAVRSEDKWTYVNNPRGGMEIWLGSKRNA